MSFEKILFVSIFKEGEGGGEGRVAYEIARWFSKHYQVVMLSPGASTGRTVDDTGFQQFTVKSAGEGSVVVPLLSVENVGKLFHFLDEYKPDIIHIHDPALLGVIVQTWAQLHRVLVFYTAHIIPSRALDFGAGEISHFASWPINEAIVEHYLLTFYQNCDAVVALNQITAKKIRDFGYKGPLEIIPNGRDLSMYNACQFTNDLNPPYHLTFVGFLSARKNQSFLLEVMKSLSPEYHLELIGEALTPSFLEELKQVTKKYHLNVTFSGQLTQHEIVEALEKTHIFVSASKMEVQSLVIIEALASGTPVVGLGNETVNELINETNGIRLPDTASPQEFAQAIQSILKLSVDDYNCLCEGARTRVNQMDWSTVMETTVKSYNRILTKKASQPENVDHHLILEKYLSQFPEGHSRDELTRIFKILTIPAPALEPPKQGAISLTILNMIGSVFVYWVLKGPVTLIRRLRKGSKE